MVTNILIICNSGTLDMQPKIIKIYGSTDKSLK